MYSVRIRNHIMIAHSLKHPDFGPARNKHGATYVVDAVFYRPELNDMQVVIDIGEAHKALEEVLAPLNYQDLDTLPDFRDQLSTTEVIARHIHDRLKALLKDVFEGQIEIILGESHIAWASYTEK